MYHKKWQRQNAQLQTLLESRDSDEGPGPSLVESPTEAQTQEQSDPSDTGGDNYQDAHYPQARK